MSLFLTATSFVVSLSQKEIMLMKQRVEEMEREAKKLRELQAAAEQAANSSEGGESSPMETEDDKTAIDGRSVYVGNVRLPSRVSYSDSLLILRWTMALHQKKSKPISRPVVLLIVSPSFATSSPDIRKGRSRFTLYDSPLSSSLSSDTPTWNFLNPSILMLHWLWITRCSVGG